MKRSRLAIVSFILALLPIVIPIVLLIGAVVTTIGAPIQVVEPVEIVDGEVVGGGKIKDTGETFSLEGLSFESFVVGFVGVYIYIFVGLVPFVGWLFAIPSIIFGIVALFKIKENNLGGKWLAVSGIVISVILSILFVVILVYLLNDPYSF
jgi:hypothetical protein